MVARPEARRGFGKLLPPRGIASAWAAPRQLGWRPGSVAAILVGRRLSWHLFVGEEGEADSSDFDSSN